MRSFISGVCLGGPCNRVQEGQGMMEDVRKCIDTSGSGLEPAGEGLAHAGYYGSGLEPAGERLN